MATKNFGDAGEADHSTLSSSATVPVTALRLDLKVDFAAQRIFGDACYSVARQASGDAELVLDTHSLEIMSVALDGSLAEWSLDPPHATLGTALRVKLTGSPGGDDGQHQSLSGTLPRLSRRDPVAPAGADCGKRTLSCSLSARQSMQVTPALSGPPRIKVPYTATVRVASPSQR